LTQLGSIDDTNICNLALPMALLASQLCLPAGIVANIVEITEEERHRAELADTGARQT
jgi:hypothetical protein